MYWWWIRLTIWWGRCGVRMGRAACVVRHRSVNCLPCVSGVPFVGLNEDIADIVCRNMYSISDTGNTKNTLRANSASCKHQNRARTSVDPGSMPSLAFNFAPDASCISLILEPPFPMTEPMREFGIMNLIVTARLPGTDGWSKGSSLIRLTMSPKAYSIFSQFPGEDAFTNLRYRVQWAAHIQDTFWSSLQTL